MMLAPAQEIGELTLVRLSTERRGTRLVWECVCHCGRPALRTVDQLKSALRSGSTPMCPACLGEWRRGAFLAEHDRKRLFWAQAFEDYGVMYGASYDEAEIARLKDALLVEGIAVGDEQPELPATIDEDGGGTSKQPSLSPDYSDYYPMRIAEPAPCDLCEKKRAIGFGCVACLSWMCAECVRADRHCNCKTWEQGRYDGMTLEAIGAEFPACKGDRVGITRTRVQQMEGRAMRKLAAVVRRLNLTGDDEKERRKLRLAHALHVEIGIATSWLPVLVEKRIALGESFLASYREADEKTRQRLTFALHVASSLEEAERIMKDYIDRSQAKQQAKQRVALIKADHERHLAERERQKEREEAERLERVKLASAARRTQLERHVDNMKERALGRSGAQSAVVHRAAKEAVHGCQPSAVADAIGAWVVAHVRYPEATSEHEWLATPERMILVIRERGCFPGDATDKSMLIAAMRLSVGLKVQYVVVGFGEPDVFTHIFTCLAGAPFDGMFDGRVTTSRVFPLEPP
jgi:hypothetical protein